MTQQELLIIWRLTGDSVALMERLGLEGEEEDVSLTIHAGQGTLQEGRTKGAGMVLIRSPQAAPDPLIAFAAVDIFDETDIFDAEGPCLVVGPAFVAEFNSELEASCKVFDVRVVMSGEMDALLADRAGLLAMSRPDVGLKALIPLQTIKTRRPVRRDDLCFVPASETLPPFFRVPWQAGSVFIRDDVRQRIERQKLRGAEFDLAPWPVG